MEQSVKKENQPTKHKIDKGIFKELRPSIAVTFEEKDVLMKTFKNDAPAQKPRKKRTPKIKP